MRNRCSVGCFNKDCDLKCSASCGLLIPRTCGPYTCRDIRCETRNEETCTCLSTIFSAFFSLVLVVKKILHYHHYHLHHLHRHQQHQRQQLKQRTTIIITIMTQLHLQHQITITIIEDDITIIVKKKLANSWYEEMTYWQFEFCFPGKLSLGMWHFTILMTRKVLHL